MPDSSPDDDTQVSDLENSTTAAGTPADTTETQDSNGPDSSTAKTAGSMLDAVQAALEPKEASPASTEPGSDANADPNLKTADGEPEGDLPEEELKALNWKTQQRFKKLTTALKAKDEEVEGLKTKAGEYDRMVGSIQKAGLDNREVDELIEVGAMLKSNPHAALKRILPIVEALQGVVGEVLPPELQERVRLGYLTEADARELNRAKASERIVSQREKQSREENEAKQQHEALTRHVNTSLAAVEGWEKQQADKDPDWHLKRREVAEQVELAIAREAQKRGQPFFPSAEESVKIAVGALKTVNDRIKRFTGKPTEIRPTTPGASPRSKPASKNTLDAINNAL